MSEFIRNFIRISVLLSVMMLIATTTNANDMNFAGKPGNSGKKLSKSEIKRMKRNELEGGTFYLQTNIWSEEGKDILSTNFHRGSVISIGTKVTIDKLKKRTIIFTVNQSGIQYNFVLAKRHSKLDIFELFGRYFGQTNPLENSLYSSLNSSEQGYINLGLICPGMTKDSVIMSYGYPPTHITPSVTSDEWTYWESRARRMLVFFGDDKVTDVQGYRFQCDTSE